MRCHLSERKVWSESVPGRHSFPRVYLGLGFRDLLVLGTWWSSRGQCLGWREKCPLVRLHSWKPILREALGLSSSEGSWSSRLPNECCKPEEFVVGNETVVLSSIKIAHLNPRNLSLPSPPPISPRNSPPFSSRATHSPPVFFPQYPSSFSLSCLRLRA